MEIEKINKHKKYKNNYFLNNGQIYSYEEVKTLFLLEDELLKNAPIKKKKQKPYHY